MTHDIGSHGPDSAAEAEILAQWTSIYDAVYRHAADRPERDFTGFRSGLNGENYTDEEVIEWIEGTVAQVLALRPRSVLDIGAGTGLITRGLLRHVDRYVGTDISPRGVARLEAGLGGTPGTEFLVRDADGIGDLGSFDVAMTNSVIQHFPNARYLRSALTRMAEVSAPAGAVFVGDVPGLHVRDLHHLCVVANRLRAPNTGTSAGEAREQLSSAAAHDRELVVHPGFFTAFAAEHGLFADIRLKPGRHPIEMNLFRYDVRLHHRGDDLLDPSTIERAPWDGGPAATVAERAAAAPGPIAITGIPRPELTPIAAALHRLRALDAASPVEPESLPTGSGTDVRGPGAHPADVVAAAAELGRTCFVTPSPIDPAAYDAVFAGSAETRGLSLPPPADAEQALTTGPSPLTPAGER
ncbi:class I SAM-dependent methyltransferase [Saccharopolyspora sp. MS10]|uniref:class I SAM-dependent methyltransferase n=1 Tax=Saccharopolyspora sp. MS10 TaxID=3385973 RepID=UPI0039A100F6